MDESFQFEQLCQYYALIRVKSPFGEIVDEYSNWNDTLYSQAV